MGAIVAATPLLCMQSNTIKFDHKTDLWFVIVNKILALLISAKIFKKQCKLISTVNVFIIALSYEFGETQRCVRERERDVRQAVKSVSCAVLRFCQIVGDIRLFLILYLPIFLNKECKTNYGFIDDHN